MVVLIAEVIVLVVVVVDVVDIVEEVLVFVDIIGVVVVAIVDIVINVVELVEGGVNVIPKSGYVITGASLQGATTNFNTGINNFNG